jgi:hypothetical protein
VNGQESRGRHSRPWLLKGEETADLSDQAESVRARGLRFLASARDIPSHDLQGDHRVIGTEDGGQESIKEVEGARLVYVAITRGPLKREKARQGVSQRRREGGHWQRRAGIHDRDGVAGVRRILGVLALAKRYGAAAADDAAKAALELQVPTYRFLRRYLERHPPARSPFGKSTR